MARTSTTRRTRTAPAETAAPQRPRRSPRLQTTETDHQETTRPSGGTPRTAAARNATRATPSRTTPRPPRPRTTTRGGTQQDETPPTESEPETKDRPPSRETFQIPQENQRNISREDEHTRDSRDAPTAQRHSATRQTATPRPARNPAELHPRPLSLVQAITHNTPPSSSSLDRLQQERMQTQNALAPLSQNGFATDATPSLPPEEEYQHQAYTTTQQLPHERDSTRFRKYLTANLPRLETRPKDYAQLRDFLDRVEQEVPAAGSSISRYDAVLAQLGPAFRSMVKFCIANKFPGCAPTYEMLTQVLIDVVSPGAPHDYLTRALAQLGPKRRSATDLLEAVTNHYQAYTDLCGRLGISPELGAREVVRTYIDHLPEPVRHRTRSRAEDKNLLHNLFEVSRLASIPLRRRPAKPPENRRGPPQAGRNFVVNPATNNTNPNPSPPKHAKKPKGRVPPPAPPDPLR
ncbi:hypothetical protein ACSSS7_008437 [Eimeria intestinalis]